MKSPSKIFVFYIFCLLCTSLFAGPIFAGNKVGNGGNGVFCDSSAQLLDFYESKIDFKTEEKNPEVIAEKQFAQLKTVAPKLAEQYLKRLKTMQQEIDYKNEVILTDVKDSKHLFTPESPDCKVLQVAIRRAKTLPGEKQFLIRQDLWKKLSLHTKRVC